MCLDWGNAWKDGDRERDGVPPTSPPLVLFSITVWFYEKYCKLARRGLRKKEKSNNSNKKDGGVHMRIKQLCGKPGDGMRGSRKQPINPMRRNALRRTRLELT